MISEKLVQQMNFINEIEKLKIVYRQNGVVGGARQENSAEHSWHIAIMAFTLQEYAEKDIEILRVIKMLLIHDLVEIYAGDVFLYDDAGRDKILH
jgi:putative hydrolase of HD superfamily